MEVGEQGSANSARTCARSARAPVPAHPARSTLSPARVEACERLLVMGAEHRQLQQTL
jgi:hypothetical protein